MINSKLAYIHSASYAKINTIFTLLITIVMYIILAILATIIISIGWKDTFPEMIQNTSIYLIIMLIISLLLITVCSYIFTYLDSKIYNYLTKYFNGIQFELTPHNEIKKIDLQNSVIILTLKSAVWTLLFSILLILSYLILSTILIKYIPTENTLLTISIIIALAIGICISIFITTIIRIFILNFFLKRNPLKINIVEKEYLELKSIDVTSFILTIGLTMITLTVISSLIGIMTTASLQMAILNLLNNIFISIISLVIFVALYNYISSKIGGIKFDIIPSNNMTQEYELPDNGN